MKNTPKVSVIIPVYNVEKFIERCVRTLFAQTLDDLEFIFVDDCSPDKSIAVMQRVLEEYPNRKPQVKLIRHKKNQGVSQSRQDGVDAATGEYIIHCDPDDWVETDMYEKLYSKAKKTNADVVTSDFIYETSDGSRTVNQRPLQMSGLSILESITGVNRKNIHGALWNKLIKANHYRKLKFPDKINFCEDVFVLFQLLPKPDKKIVYLNKCFYHYVVNQDGLVHDISDKSLQMDRNLMSQVLLLGDKDKRIKTCAESFVIATMFNRAYLNSSIDDKQFKNYYGGYLKFLNSNHQLRKIDRLLIKLALKGKFHFSKRISNQLIRTNKSIKSIISVIRNKLYGK